MVYVLTESEKKFIKIFRNIFFILIGIFFIYIIGNQLEFFTIEKTEIKKLSYIETIDRGINSKSEFLYFNTPNCYEVYQDLDTNKKMIMDCSSDKFFNSNNYRGNKINGSWNLTYQYSKNLFGIEKNKIVSLNKYISS